MKVAFISGPFPKISKTVPTDQIIGLIDRGHDIKIIATQDPNEPVEHQSVSEYNLSERTYYYQDHAPTNTVVAASKIPSLLVSNYNKNPQLAANLFKRLLKDPVDTGRLVYWSLPFFDNEFDIIHCRFGPLGIIGAKLKSLDVSGKLLGAFHGHGIRQAEETGPEIYEELFEKADYLIGNSTHVTEKIEEFGADRNKIGIHYPGINPSLFSCNPLNKAKHGSSVTVGTVSRLSEEKGVGYGLAAIARVIEQNPAIDLNYRIIGDGPKMGDLQAQASDTGIDSSVTFCGFQPREQVIRELQDADIFVLPSLKEALGVVLLEAQATCTPIVATNIGGIPDAVNAGESAFLVPAKDPTNMADKISTLINNPETRQEMGTKGREYIKSNFDIRTKNDELVALYESLLD